METTPVMAKPPLSQPLSVAAIALGAMAVVQIVALAFYFASNARIAVKQARAVAEPPKISGARVATAVPEKPAIQARPLTRQDLTPDVPMPPANPTPVPMARIKSMNKALVSDNIAIAISAREKGDMTAALTKLKEAQLMAPDQPDIVAELAVTYEKMGIYDKAMEHWRRVREFGESAGLFYEMADQKLKNGVGPPIPRAELVRPAQSQNRGLFGMEEGADAAVGGSLPPIPEDEALARSVDLADVQLIEQAPGDAMKRLTLRATVQAKPGSIERQKVQIMVLFYDIIDDKDVTQTSAEVVHTWDTLPADWADNGVEILVVDYKLAQPQVPEGEKAENRKYYGYEVRLYYDNELQGVRAEPTRLLNLYPAQQTLTPDTPTE